MFVWNALRKPIILAACIATVGISQLSAVQRPQTQRSAQLTIGGVVLPSANVALASDTNRLHATATAAGSYAIEATLKETSTMADRYFLTVESTAAQNNESRPYSLSCDGTRIDVSQSETQIDGQIGDRVLMITATEPCRDTLVITVCAR